MPISFIIIGYYFIEVSRLVQNRLLPLLCLIISSQVYCEDTLPSQSSENDVTGSNNVVTNNSEIDPKDDTQTITPSSETTQQVNSTTSETNQNVDSVEDIKVVDGESEKITFEPTTDTADNAPTSPSTQSSEQVTDSEDDGIDEDLIAELLDEGKGKEKVEKPSTGTDKKAVSETLNTTKKSSSTESSSVGSSTWLPEIEFGYRSEQGNEDERALNARLSLSHISGRLRNSGEIKIYLKNEDGEEDEREQTYQLQSDYKISPKFYIYGNFKGIDSKYSSYFHDYTVSTGLGYQVTNTETLKVETELGPGYRYQEPNTDEIDDDDPIFPDNVNEPIVRASLILNWKPLDRTSFNFDGTMVSGSSNTRFDTEISIINDITEDIALKISQSIEHLSRVPNNLEKTDTILTINILYSPK
ncbi:hypothetical protein GCM10007931_02060 [Vibrio algivorus]|uniref:DUF481 domain-containing protein n=1 Tax=Vibrio algivorus TaxID=1667024 RepID=A0ABQ6EK26_9VIBR|nr:hypothetical protein GCM10007931_02060 [Vibrio algivorus]